MGVGGQGVAHRAALHFSEFQQPEHRFRQAFFHLHSPAVKFHPRRQRVPAFPGLGNVGRLAKDVHIHLAGAGHQFSRPAGNHPGRKPRPQVQPEDSLHPVCFKNTRLTQVSGAASGLLRRLKYQQHIVGQGFLFAEPPGQFQNDGHMTVVAAGVHTARVQRRIFRPGFFRNGQGIHVRPEGNGRFPPKVKPGAQRPFHGGKYPAIQALQSLFQVCQSLGQRLVQLRNPVELPAVGTDLHGDCLLKIGIGLLYVKSRPVSISHLCFPEKDGMMRYQK